VFEVACTVVIALADDASAHVALSNERTAGAPG